MGSEKMSKSLGNVTLIHDLLKEWDGEVIRLALLKAHYRSELQWSEELLRESKKQLDGWYRSKSKSSELIDPDFTNADSFEKLYLDLDLISTLVLIEKSDQATTWHQVKLDEMKASPLSANTSEMSSEERVSSLHLALNDLLFSANLLGLLQKDPKDWFRGNTSDDEEDEINDLIQQRDAAKTAAIAAKKLGDKSLMGEQFKRSDDIRDKLKARGIVLEDGPPTPENSSGTTWRRE